MKSCEYNLSSHLQDYPWEKASVSGGKDFLKTSRSLKNKFGLINNKCKIQRFLRMTENPSSNKYDLSRSKCQGLCQAVTI